MDSHTAAPDPEAVSVRPGKPAAGNSGGTHLSPLSAKNAGQTRLNRITQAVFSTLTWYIFWGAGHQSTDSTSKLLSVRGAGQFYRTEHSILQVCTLATQALVER
jgi:hypothetical protein